MNFVMVKRSYIQHELMNTSLSIFFGYDWNNIKYKIETI